MTTKPSLPLAAVAAFLALAACNGKTTTTVDAGANEAEANVTAPVAPLLMIKGSKIYRCKDNSVAYVDFMNDDKTANVRTDKDGKATILHAPAAGEAFEGEGFTLKGNGEEVTLTLPGKGAQSCKAKG